MIILTRESTKGADGRRFFVDALVVFPQISSKVRMELGDAVQTLFLCLCSFVNKGNSKNEIKPESFPGPSRSLHGGPVGDKAEL